MEKIIVKTDLSNSSSLILIMADNLGLLKNDNREYGLVFEEEKDIKNFDICFLSKEKFINKNTKIIKGNLKFKVETFEYSKNEVQVKQLVEPFLSSRNDSLISNANNIFEDALEVGDPEKVYVIFSTGLNNKEVEKEFVFIINKAIRTIKQLYPEIIEEIIDEVLMVEDNVKEGYINSEFNYCT